MILNRDLLNKAKEHSAERMQYEYNRAGYKNEIRKSMILLGTIGQLGFKQFLDDKNFSNYTLQLQAGKYDDFDFTLGDEIVEIKTSGYDSSFNSLNLLYSEDQLFSGKQKKFSYCVQLFVNGYDRNTKKLNLDKCNTLKIAGYIEFDKIQDYKNPEPRFWGDHYKVPIFKLKDINKLLSKIKNDKN